jgi:hypothetical protein
MQTCRPRVFLVPNFENLQSFFGSKEGEVGGCNHLDERDYDRVETCQKLPSKFLIFLPRFIVDYET